MRGANSGTGTAYLTVAPTFTLVIFREGGLLLNPQFSVYYFADHCFLFVFFSIGHCIVCFYSIDHCIVCLFSIDHCIVCLFSIDHFWCKDNSCDIIIVMFQENLLGGND